MSTSLILEITKLSFFGYDMAFIYLLLDIFFIYISNAIPNVPYTLPLPAPQPTHTPIQAPGEPR